MLGAGLAPCKREERSKIVHCLGQVRGYRAQKVRRKHVINTQCMTILCKQIWELASTLKTNAVRFRINPQHTVCPWTNKILSTNTVQTPQHKPPTAEFKNRAQDTEAFCQCSVDLGLECSPENGWGLESRQVDLVKALKFLQGTAGTPSSLQVATVGFLRSIREARTEETGVVAAFGVPCGLAQMGVVSQCWGEARSL